MKIAEPKRSNGCQIWAKRGKIKYKILHSDLSEETKRKAKIKLLDLKANEIELLDDQDLVSVLAYLRL